MRSQLIVVFFALVVVLGWWQLVRCGGVWVGFGRSGRLGVVGGCFSFLFDGVGGGLPMVGHGWIRRWRKGWKEELEEKHVFVVGRQWQPL